LRTNLKHYVFYFWILFLLTILLPGCNQNSQPGTTITVITYNVGNEGLPIPRTEQVAEVVRRNGLPDLLFVQDAPWKIKMKDLAGSLGFDHFVSGRGMSSQTHLGILSNLPLSNPDAIRFSDTSNHQRPGALSANIRIADKTVLLCCVHLESLSRRVNKMRRDSGSALPNIIRMIRDETLHDTPRVQSVEQLLAWIETKQKDAIVIGGDFNTFFFSRPIRSMNKYFHDVLWFSSDYFSGTYTKLNFPMKPRIDFIFHSKNIECLEAGIIRETAGDHYPIRAVLSFPGPAQKTK